MSDESPAVAVPGLAGVADNAVDAPGTTRFHLLGSPAATPAARDRVRAWCRDRAVPGEAADRLVVLVQAATRVALERDPRRVAVGLRWLDPDRIILDVRSRGCSSPGPVAGRPGRRSPHASPAAVVFDVAAQAWGSRLRATESVQWFVVDTTAT
jgi:hypothetical protein